MISVGGRYSFKRRFSALVKITRKREGVEVQTPFKHGPSCVKSREESLAIDSCICKKRQVYLNIFGVFLQLQGPLQLLIIRLVKLYLLRQIVAYIKPWRFASNINMACSFYFWIIVQCT